MIWEAIKSLAATSFTIVISSATVDTNILIYSIDVSEGDKHVRAQRLVNTLSIQRAMLPLQALNELFFVCIRKRILPLKVAESYNHSLIQSMRIIPPSQEDLNQAMQLHREHRLQFFDALLISTASRAGCTTFFSEDLQHGRDFGALRIINPFTLTQDVFEHLLA